MNIALIGASGFVGTAILKEALDRGHSVKAILRNPENVTIKDDKITLVKADILDPEQVKSAVEGTDAVISAYNPGWSNPDIYEEFLKGSASIQAGTKESGVKRYIVIGGAGSLEVAPGVQAVDTADFPAAIKPGASAARDYQRILKDEKELDWTFFSPAIEMHEGGASGRIGKFRLGKDNPVFNEQGRSILSPEDVAVAVVDELEQNKHIKARFTAAY